MTSLLLATSNGTGMGHLTRQVAVAKSAPGDATIFSLSLGLPLATGLGVQGEYCPSYEMPWIASREWQTYLRDRLVAITRETRSSAVLFDGVAPYTGIGLAATEMRDVAFVWLRRGMWREGMGGRQLAKSAYFDLIIEPGDLGATADAGATAGRGDAVGVGPISILETLDLLPRAEAREILALPAEGPVALVTLGSGRLGDVAGPGRIAVETILNRLPNWHLAVTRSPVALNEVPVASARRITELSGVYPLARYLGAFDMAISSAGYNAVHELVPAGVPTLFVANTSTRTDDQTARARGIAGAELGLACDDTDLTELPRLIEEVAADDSRRRLSDASAAIIDQMTGASGTARAATDFADGFTRRKRSPSAVAALGWQRVKDMAKNMLGDEGTARLKTLLGREATDVHGRTTVTLDGLGTDDVTRLDVVTDLSPDQLRAGGPVEHLLPGSSDEYESLRRRLIDVYYDVVD